MLTFPVPHILADAKVFEAGYCLVDFLVHADERIVRRPVRSGRVVGVLGGHGGRNLSHTVSVKVLIWANADFSTSSLAENVSRAKPGALKASPGTSATPVFSNSCSHHSALFSVIGRRSIST